LPRIAVILAVALACKKKDEGAAPSPSASSSASSNASSDPASIESIDAGAKDDDDLDDPVDPDEDDLDASLAAADATIDGDASDGDADARPRGDAAGDAPLLGTKTFPDEVPESGFRYVTSDAAKVHKSPKDGMAFVSLQKGTQVWLVARLFDWYRIRFVDPGTEQARQGWIFITNVIGPRRKTCPEDWIWHDQYGGYCEKQCDKTTDCKAIPGYKCSGTGCFYAQVE
jgi:hypothetical protein